MDPVAEEWKEKGNKCMKEDKHIEAMLNYTQAINIDPDNPAYYSNRSSAFLKIQQHYFALKDAEEAISKMSKWPKGHFRKGQVQMAAEHYEEAMHSFKKAMELDPTDKILNENLVKASISWKEQRKKEGRLPWLGGMFGLLISVILVIADETIAQDNAILQGDYLRFTVVAVITAVGYGLGIMYRYMLQSQRCSLFDPPLDLLGEQNEASSPSNSTPDASGDGAHSESKTKGGGAKQRKKGRS